MRLSRQENNELADIYDRITILINEDKSRFLPGLVGQHNKVELEVYKIRIENLYSEIDCKERSILMDKIT